MRYLYLSTIFGTLFLFELVFIWVSDFPITKMSAVFIYLTMGGFSLISYGAFDHYKEGTTLVVPFFHRRLGMLFVGFAGMVVVFCAIHVLYSIFFDIKLLPWNFTLALIGTSILGNWVVAVVEEMVFRGVLQGMLVKISRKLPVVSAPVFAIILPAILFLYAHIQTDWLDRSEQAAFVFFTGLIFGILTFRTGNLWAAIGAHWGCNVIQEIAFGSYNRPFDFHQGIFLVENNQKDVFAVCIAIVAICFAVFSFRRKMPPPAL
jgi:membrane protease YdiL (CAAX protease family)